MSLINHEVPGHRRDFVGCGRRIPRVVWPGTAKLAVNIVVKYEEGSEREIIQHGLDKGGVWFARRNDSARWWLAHHEEFEHV
jgi:hypothetical protein